MKNCIVSHFVMRYKLLYDFFYVLEMWVLIQDFRVPHITDILFRFQRTQKSYVYEKRLTVTRQFICN